jgi:hypothetical protein
MTRVIAETGEKLEEIATQYQTAKSQSKGNNRQSQSGGLKGVERVGVQI